MATQWAWRESDTIPCTPTCQGTTAKHFLCLQEVRNGRERARSGESVQLRHAQSNKDQMGEHALLQRPLRVANSKKKKNSKPILTPLPTSASLSSATTKQPGLGVANKPHTNWHWNSLIAPNLTETSVQVQMKWLRLW